MTRSSAWYFILILGFAPPLHAAELKIATWNLNWLTSRTEGLPPDVKPRQQEDFDLLRGYAAELNADVVAFQEVDNRDSARRVFPPETYSIHMTRDRVRQRVGLAVRRGIPYEINPDVTAIAGDPLDRLRSGVDITLRLPSGPVRVLGVHLKSGCQHVSLLRAPRTACATLRSQLDVVTDWVAARRDEGGPFMLLGDFNRGMDRRDPFIRAIRAAAPVIRATEGHSSPCWGAKEAFIDHVLLGGGAGAWVVPGSLRVLVYRETDQSWQARLSDHCPVSVRLAMPD